MCLKLFNVMAGVAFVAPDADPTAKGSNANPTKAVAKSETPTRRLNSFFAPIRAKYKYS